MDENKCKAKRKDNGKWIEGYYVRQDDTTYCFKEDYEKSPENTKHYIVFDRMTDWGLPNQHLMTEIVPGTLCRHTEVINQDGNKKPVWENHVYRWTDSAWGICTGIVKYGQYKQDSSGGEYPPDDCIGFYVEVIDVEPFDYTGETKEEAERYYPDYIRQFTVCKLAKMNAEHIGNIFDNPELLKN